MLHDNQRGTVNLHLISHMLRDKDANRDIKCINITKFPEMFPGIKTLNDILYKMLLFNRGKSFSDGCRNENECVVERVSCF